MGSPAVVIVTEYRDTDDGSAIAVKDSVVVDEHTLGKILISLVLYFDVDIDPLLNATFAPDFDELIGQAFASISIGGNSPKPQASP